MHNYYNRSMSECQLQRRNWVIFLTHFREKELWQKDKVCPQVQMYPSHCSNSIDNKKKTMEIWICWIPLLSSPVFLILPTLPPADGRQRSQHSQQTTHCLGLLILSAAGMTTETRADSISGLSKVWGLVAVASGTLKPRRCCVCERCRWVNGWYGELGAPCRGIDCTAIPGGVDPLKNHSFVIVVHRWVHVDR